MGGLARSGVALVSAFLPVAFVASLSLAPEGEDEDRVQIRQEARERNEATRDLADDQLPTISLMRRGASAAAPSSAM